MCPVCLAASGLYVAGGLSTGAVTTFFAIKLLRKRLLAKEKKINRQYQEAA